MDRMRRATLLLLLCLTVALCQNTTYNPFTRKLDFLGGTSATAIATMPVTTVGSSATPNFVCGSPIADTAFAITITTNVTAPTFDTTCTANTVLQFQIKNGAGGPWTFSWMTGFSSACPIDPTLNSTTTETFLWDGTTAHLIGCTSDSGNFSITGKNIGTPATPPSGSTTVFTDLTTKAIKTVSDGGIVTDYAAHGFGAAFSGSSNVVNAAVTYGVVHYAPCKIGGWSIQTDATALTFKVWRVATGGTALPTVAGVINTSGLSLSSGTYVRSTTVSDFTSTTIAANDQYAIVLSGITGSPTFANIFVECNQGNQ